MNKICTSIEQSKKLIELGVDVNTADMFYRDNGVDVKLMWEHLPDVQVTNPAWSLTALLDILPSSTLDTSNDHYYRLHCMERFTEWYDNSIDACVEMIIKLKEKNLL